MIAGRAVADGQLLEVARVNSPATAEANAEIRLGVGALAGESSAGAA